MRKLLLFLMLMMFGGSVWATTVTYQYGVSGYTGYQDAQTYNFSTNEHNEFSQARASANIYEIMYFGGMSIPSTATVTSATLTINETETDNNNGNIGIYKVLDPDGLGAGTVYTWCGSACDSFNVHATYDNKKAEATTIHWDNASDKISSANIISSVANSAAIPLNYTGPIVFTITSTVQDWVTTPAHNLGLVATMGNIADPGARWDSYLGTTPPILSVTYTTAPTTTTVSVNNAGINNAQIN